MVFYAGSQCMQLAQTCDAKRKWIHEGLKCCRSQVCLLCVLCVVQTPANAAVMAMDMISLSSHLTCLWCHS